MNTAFEPHLKSGNRSGLILKNIDHPLTSTISTMKHSLLLVAILLFWTSAPSNILLAGNSPALFDTALGADNPAYISNNIKSTTDPFIGAFTMSAYGQVVGTVTITHTGGNQYQIDSGDGHDMATKNGSTLEGTSQGIPFRILIKGSNLVMELLGSAFDLTRISRQSVTPETSVTGNGTGNSDPFTGTFEIFGDNESFGKVIIICTGGVNYQLSSASGVDVANKSGSQLSGISNGASFIITLNGNDLSYSIQGVTIQFRRLDATQIGQSSSASNTIDQRLLGVWCYTHIQKSGSSQMVTDYKIGFKKDGTYNTKTSWAGMGSEGENPQQFGQYQIVSMNESGGIVRLDGKDTEYFFSGGNVRIGTTIYEFIRK